jgi:hypothetical protein
MAGRGNPTVCPAVHPTVIRAIAAITNPRFNNTASRDIEVLFKIDLRLGIPAR